MKVKVTLYLSGTVFEEIVQARNDADARLTALGCHPTARFVSVTAVFV